MLVALGLLLLPGINGELSSNVIPPLFTLLPAVEHGIQLLPALSIWGVSQMIPMIARSGGRYWTGTLQLVRMWD